MFILLMSMYKSILSLSINLVDNYKRPNIPSGLLDGRNLGSDPGSSGGYKSRGDEYDTVTRARLTFTTPTSVVHVQLCERHLPRHLSLSPAHTQRHPICSLNFAPEGKQSMLSTFTPTVGKTLWGEEIKSP